MALIPFVVDMPAEVVVGEEELEEGVVLNTNVPHPPAATSTRLCRQWAFANNQQDMKLHLTSSVFMLSHN